MPKAKKTKPPKPPKVGKTQTRKIRSGPNAGDTVTIKRPNTAKGRSDPGNWYPVKVVKDVGRGSTLAVKKTKKKRVLDGVMSAKKR